ncbi:MAG: 3-deoxy-D-manno-octulosonic acid transferase [Desulfurivibrio sp.]|nr:3-deoxy-D-manno-octulosonic acid transferase [Desulfurivibrio sp.]MBU3936216.1 3-deoxy-D-manno-octulosonic acid transferase [Pseudomonadota bacterium]MBU4033814.1 3-deoxy-D-manno-octulosonic acid transferase [Pseudomonadota bacterium]MBU4118646.1 3-deoxy-D-manno-octulosonic acid transferase [Pseudomonadota bacterium]
MDMVSGFFYNLFMTVGVIVFAPLLFVKVILTPKYRSRIGKRLGFALGEKPGGSGFPRIWVHALSVGEVASARNLVQELRCSYPQGVIIFSASTRAGETFARSTLGEHVDCFVPFPFDLLWSVKRLLSWVNPDLFILVETDFWPNFLRELKQRSIPSLLVNGRVSESSMSRYTTFRWLFAPLFNSFQALAMQTEQDGVCMRQLGVDPERLVVLGNLKYDAALPGGIVKPGLDRKGLHIPVQALVWVAGSTHRGEEEILFNVFQKLVRTYADLFLILAPRDVARGAELAAMADQRGLLAFRRSSSETGTGSVLILDTLGELSAVYNLCDVAFVGGSLVDQRGHNPLEPAVHGKPVLFGPFMEDFAEISRDLLAVEGGVQIRNEEELCDCLSLLLGDPARRERTGRKAQGLIASRRGVTEAHIALIRKMLTQKEGR